MKNNLANILGVPIGIGVAWLALKLVGDKGGILAGLGATNPHPLHESVGLSDKYVKKMQDRKNWFICKGPAEDDYSWWEKEDPKYLPGKIDPVRIKITRNYDNHVSAHYQACIEGESWGIPCYTSHSGHDALAKMAERMAGAGFLD